MCISNGVDGGLMSNARWRGVPLSTVLNAAALMPGIVEVKLSGADGYTDTIPIAKAMEPTTVLVYAMNGEPLSAKHGYPVRVIVPGMYGEKNVKWVTRIEPLVHPVQGFYEQQGWGPDFSIHVRARIDAPEGGHPLPAGMPTDIRGIAFGGDRGVSRVEVSTDVYPPTFEILKVAPGTDPDSLPPLPGPDEKSAEGAPAAPRTAAN